VRDSAKNSVKEKLARDEVVASITVRLVPTVEIVQFESPRAASAASTSASAASRRARTSSRSS